MSFILIFLVACSVDESSPRLTYNEGTKLLRTPDAHEQAIEKLLDSRDRAKSDSELRQHAAFNLALGFAQKAIVLESEDKDEAAQTYQQAASWFQDAIRINPNDQDARRNLEIVLKRLQMLADQRSQGENTLEKRLARLLEDVRMIRDNMRVLKHEIDMSNTSQDPTAFKSRFDDLAIKSRISQSDASTILQLSNEERSSLEGKTEENQSEEDKIRIVQLSNLEGHLSLGREEIADSRMVLRKLNIESSFENLEDAVQRIIRAQEQLMEPIKILQIIAQQQQQLLQQSAVLNQYNSITQNMSSPPQPESQLPTWFDGTFLADQQIDLYDRCYEIVQRFEYATNAPVDDSNAEQAEFMMLLQGALPHLQKALIDMKTSESNLQRSSFSDAVMTEMEVLKSLAMAIEYFSDAKTLINIALQTQNELVVLFTPFQGSSEEDHTSSSSSQNPFEALTAEEKEQEITSRLEQNNSRIQRLQQTLVREKEKELTTLQQQASQSGEDISESQQNLEEKYSYAEELRSQAENSLSAMMVEEAEKNVEVDYLKESQVGQEKLEELAKLFYNLIEHMQQLLQDQGKLRDSVVSTSIQKYQKMQEESMLHQGEQNRLKEIANTISGVLEEQADGLNESGKVEEGERYSDAYVEMAMAGDRMTEVIDNLEDVITEQGGMSHTLDDSLNAQQLAMESIAAAIQALQPPKPQDGEDEEQQEEEKMNQQQAEKKKQQAKEKEAERRKNQQNQQQEPVAKDW
jgi:hypothetical protein